ncbi:exodeoxyribonuclease VII small subunit [Seongchinamella sediminis]|uniref:Exodeoxyribonuclease 7 small subunit n=1 Tax=Seongchinamella sediminis TaxID=2283635 RepID=A0A3L7DYA3_9GAMM|nr:exodeoxyribonuclease VII small subunit [Seongchinamella sediminis]RLQ22224.1 exodeoxyribonuclease VII small subunit [Seongchinamella sediminis]
MASKTTPKNFASKLQRLESLVAGLESTDQSLESALQNFEQGIKLVRDAQQELAIAEQKVNELLQEPPGQQAEQD